MALDPIVIIGSGFAGLGMGVRLKQAGIHDFVILEKADGVGGTWRANHYPGAACDIESHLYSFSFEPNPHWSRSFAPQPEILAYLEHVADKYTLRPHLRFGVEVKSGHFDAKAARWRLTTQTGETIDAHLVISGTGGLSKAALPDIPGLADFAGPRFHSAAWDDDVSIDGKRVAVIGTGASAIQIIPTIAPQVDKLLVFQRTAPWVMPKRDRALGAGEQQLFSRVPFTQTIARTLQYVQHELTAIGFVKEPRLLQLVSKLVLRYLEKSVPDPALRARLTPHFAMGCKRILLSNDYYPAMTRGNVELVTDGITRIEREGIRTKDGTLHRAHVLVLATGFYAAEMCAPFDARGKDGVSLVERWSSGPEAYLGTAIAGYPNLFLIVGPNVGLGHSSMVYMIESQIQYILDCVQRMQQKGLRTVEVKADAQARFNRELQAKFPKTVWSSGCASWYQTKDGKNTTLWPGWTFEFRQKTRHFDASAYDLGA